MKEINDVYIVFTMALPLPYHFFELLISFILQIWMVLMVLMLIINMLAIVTMFILMMIMIARRIALLLLVLLPPRPDLAMPGQARRQKYFMLTLFWHEMGIG